MILWKQMFRDEACSYLDMSNSSVYLLLKVNILILILKITKDNSRIQTCPQTDAEVVLQFSV